MKDYGIGFFTVAGVVPAFIIIGLVLLLGGVGLYVAGLLNAVLYFLAGVGFLWFLSLFGVFKSAWGWLIAAITLLVMPLWGWGVDNIHFLSMMPNPANWVASQPTITLYANDLTGDVLSFVVSFEFLGTVMSTVGAILGAVSILMMKRKKHR